MSTEWLAIIPPQTSPINLDLLSEEEKILLFTFYITLLQCSHNMADITAKNLDSAENSRTFLDGSKRTVVVLGSVAIGRGEYLPGWKWSKHARPQTGKNSEAHIGYILSGQMVVRGADGKEATLRPGDAFEVQPEHDAWVVGDEPCVALDFEHLK